MIKMNEEEKMPTYGKLRAENFRLEHNYRIVSEREAKLQNNWNELKKWVKEYEENSYGLGSYETGIADGLGDVLKKMQELEQGKDESN